MTDFLNIDAAFFEKSFPANNGRSRDNHLDTSEVLAAALEQMDDIIASTNEPKKGLDHHNLSCIPTNTHNDKCCIDPSPVIQVQDSSFISDNKATVNRILDHLKDYILSRNDANDNFVPNGEFNISAAKVVFVWLQRQLRNLSVDIEAAGEFQNHTLALKAGHTCQLFQFHRKILMENSSLS